MGLGVLPGAPRGYVLLILPEHTAYRRHARPDFQRIKLRRARAADFSQRYPVQSATDLTMQRMLFNYVGPSTVFMMLASCAVADRAALVGGIVTGEIVDPGGKRFEEQEIQRSIDAEVAAEASHERPSAGCRTWREYWAWRVRLWRKYSTADRWISYMKLRRQLAGLPNYRF